MSMVEEKRSFVPIARRRFQFSLRTLLIFCVTLAIFIGGICTHHKAIQFWTVKLWFVFFPTAMLAMAIYGRNSLRAFSLGAGASFLWITFLLVATLDEHLREYLYSHNPQNNAGWVGPVYATPPSVLLPPVQPINMSPSEASTPPSSTTFPAPDANSTPFAPGTSPNGLSDTPQQVGLPAATVTPSSNQPVTVSPNFPAPVQPSYTAMPTGTYSALMATYWFWDYLYPILYLVVITSISCLAGLLTVVLRAYVHSSERCENAGE